MSKSSRYVTCAIIESVKSGCLTWEAVARAALCYLSEFQVNDMARDNEFFSCSECGGIMDDEDDLESGICHDCTEPEKEEEEEEEEEEETD